MTSSAQLQREADAARVGLADTLVQLRDGMAPSALSGEALALAKDTGLSLVKTLSEQARANPVPALLIGAGLVMLLTRTTGGDVVNVAGSAFRSAASTGASAARQAASAAGQTVRGAASTAASAASTAASAAAGAASSAVSAAAGAASSAVTRASDAVMDTADRVTESVGQRVGTLRERASGEVDAAGERYSEVRGRVQEAADQGRRTLHDRQDQARQLAQEAREKAQTMAEESMQSIKQLLEEQPILMAALGAALGAAVGAALPLSRQEKDLLGSVGASAVGAGREALSSAAGVLREEVAHVDLGGKAKELADKVVEGVAGGLPDRSEIDAENKKGMSAAHPTIGS